MLASICGSRSQKPRKQYSRTVKRLFTGFQTNFQRLWRNMERKPLKSHATVVGGQATVGRLSINVFSTFQAIRNFFEKVAERSRDSGRRSRDRRPTVKQRFLDVSSNLGKFWKKSLNGHATVVGGHATVGRLSNNVFWTFQAIWENFEKSRWTVTRQWSEVTRPSADCQTTFFGRFKQFEKNLKKVAERSRDSGRRSRDRRPTVKQRFWTFQAIWENFEKSRWTVTRQWSEVTRPSADCQTTFFGRFKQLEKNLKKVAERSRDSGRRSRDRRPTVKQRFWTFQAIRKILKKVAERSRDSGRRSRDRRPTVKQRFLDVSSNYKSFRKKSLNGHATVVGGHATVGWLSNNVFGRFKRLGNFL